MSQFLNVPFDGSGSLSGYAENGATFTALAGTGAVGGGEAWPTGASYDIFYASTAPDAIDVDVEVGIRLVGSGGSAIATAFWYGTPSGNNPTYRVQYQNGVIKVYAGASQVKSISVSVTIGQTYVLKASIKSDGLHTYWNGTELTDIFYSCSNAARPSYVGLWMYGASTSTTGNHATYLTATGIARPPTSSVTLSQRGTDHATLAVSAAGEATPVTTVLYRHTVSGFTPPATGTSLGSEASVTDTGLTPSTDYYYRAVATDATNATSLSTELHVKTASVYATFPGEYHEAVLADVPLAYYRCGESSGTQANDISGNNLSAAYRGTCTLGQAGGLGDDADTAVQLDGSTAYIDPGSPSALEFSGIVTVECVFKMLAWPADRAMLISKGYDGSKEGLYLYVKSDHNLAYGCYEGSTYGLAASGNLELDKWYHIALTWDGGAWRLYLDGDEISHAAYEGITGLLSSTASWCFGAEKFSGTYSRFANVVIDEVAIYRSALTQPRIAYHAALRPALDEDMLAAREQFLGWKFGAFFHFNMSTFTAVEYGNPATTENTFNPTALDIDQWLTAAKAAGMKYAVLTTKHHDGFCLWPSATTTHDIASSSWYAANGNRDIVSEFVAKCRQHDLKVGLYYSVLDWNWGAAHVGFNSAQYTQFVKDQLYELLTDYGDIDFLWTDGWGWSVGHTMVSYSEVYAYIKSLQPNCLLHENSHNYSYRDSDVAVWETPIDGNPTDENCVATETCNTVDAGGVWFWKAYNPTPTLLTAEVIRAAKAEANARNSTYLLNFGPDTRGLLIDSEVSLLNSIVIPIGITLTGDDIDEGDSYTLGVALTGDDVNTISSFTVDWGDGTTTEGIEGDNSHTYLDNGTYTITVAVTDENATYTETRSALVANVPPVVTLTGLSVTDEGQSYTLSITLSDPGNDTIASVGIDWGDGTTTEGQAGSNTHTYADDGEYTITVTATDEDGSYDATKIVTVSKVSPVLTLTGNATVVEGSVYTLTLSSTDAGTSHTQSWTIDWGDGTVAAGATGNNTHTYADGPATRTITVTAVDEDGTYTATKQITVTNVSPTVTLSGSSSVTEYTLYMLGISITDAGTDTITSISIDWGDETSPTAGVIGDNTHRYADGPATRTITVTVVDEDGTYTATKAITVTNVAPTITLSGNAYVDQGASYALTIGVTDPGTDTVSGISIRWGDDSPIESGVLGVNHHTFAEPIATNTITVVVEDEDGEYTATKSITVNATPITIPTLLVLAGTVEAVAWATALVELMPLSEEQEGGLMLGFYIGTDTMITVKELKNATGAYVNDAEVVGTLKNLSGQTIAGYDDIEFVYVPESDGQYQGVLPASAPLLEDKEYDIFIAATKDTNKMTIQVRRAAGYLEA